MPEHMERKDSLNGVEEKVIVLDRSNPTSQNLVNPSHRVLEHEHDGRSSPDFNSSVEPRSPTQRLVDSIKDSKDDAKAKIKKTLHIGKSSHEPEAPKPPVLADTPDEKSESRLAPDQPPDKEILKDFVHHPYDTVKAKVSNQGKKQVASNAGVKEVAHGQDVDIVEASTAVECATTEKEKLLAIESLDELLRERQNTYVRWTLDRHVSKVRSMPRATIRKPMSTFRKQNPEGQIEMDWKAYTANLLDYHAHRYGRQYIGYGCDPPEPSQQAAMPNIERILILTSPLQQFSVFVRRVYCWEEPKKTAQYMGIYFILWYMNLLLAGLLCSVIYTVIQRHFRKQTIAELREDIGRREDAKSTALSLTEFIDKHGEKDWADEILQSLGSWFMVQSGDVADFCETVQNFCEWRNSARTVSVLCILTAAMLITAFTPSWILVKMLVFAAGFAFFCLFPIAANYPEYRLLLSPSKRLLWNIPTHAEWAISFIQAEGTRYKQTLQSPSNATSSHKFYGSYKAYHEKSPGHLLISTQTIRFESSIGHSVLFDLPYIELERLEKYDKILRKHLPTRLAAEMREDLRLVTKSGKEWRLKNVEKRSEAFAQAVGFSGKKWQVVW